MSRPFPLVQGLVYEGRPSGRLTPQKLEFARSASEAERVPSGGSLLEAVQQLQPSALIGAAAKQGAFSADTIKALTKVSPHVAHCFASSAQPALPTF